MRKFIGFISALTMACLSISPVQAQKVDEDLRDYIRANTIFFIYHELGHALIDLMLLPVFGQEEDAADVLGVVLSETINEEEDTEFIMLAAADNFAYMAETAAQEGYELAFWDTHGLDQQRYFTVLCLFYGANPDSRGFVTGTDMLPEDRQQTCPEEYQLAQDSWGPVLDEIAAPNEPSEWLIFTSTGQAEDAFEKIVRDTVSDEAGFLNDLFLPEFSLSIDFARCGEANAYYEPDAQKITICAELAALFSE